MSFDTSNYAKSPSVSAAETVALLASLIAAATVTKTHAKVSIVLRGIRTLGETLRLALFAPIEKSASNTRDIDLAMDRIWRSIEARLSAAYELNATDADEARRVYGIIFPDGLSFTNLRYLLQWTEGEAIFSRIEAKSLTDSLNHLVGEEYITIAKTRHEAYGTAIGATAALDAPPVEPGIAEPLRQVRAGIAAYGRIVAALVDMGDLSEADASAALAPIDRVRAAQRERRGADAVVDQEALGNPLPVV